MPIEDEHRSINESAELPPPRPDDREKMLEAAIDEVRRIYALDAEPAGDGPGLSFETVFAPLQTLVEKLQEAAPDGGLDDSPDEQLRRWIENILTGKAGIAPDFLLDPGVAKTYRHLPDHERIVQEAAEKSRAESIVRNMETLFEALPATFADSFVQDAIRSALHTSPLSVLRKHATIRKRLADGDRTVRTAVSRFARHDSPHAIMQFAELADALGDDASAASLADELVSLDPNFAISVFEDAKKNERFIAALRMRHMPQTVVLERIFALKDIPATVKEDAATLLDQFIFDQKLTPEEAVEITKDEARFTALLQEIKRRPNYLGAVSIARALHEPLPASVVRPEDQ